jgi:hypothetical protein
VLKSGRRALDSTGFWRKWRKAAGGWPPPLSGLGNWQRSDSAAVAPSVATWRLQVPPSGPGQARRTSDATRQAESRSQAQHVAILSSPARLGTVLAESRPAGTNHREVPELEIRI